MELVGPDQIRNTRWGLNLRDRDLKKEGRDQVAEMLIERAREAIGKIDLSDGEPFLREDFGLRSAVLWVQHKFGIELEFDEVRDLEPDQFRQLVYERAERAYDEKEAQYPVMAACTGTRPAQTIPGWTAKGWPLGPANGSRPK
jgi:preprotein translocase subunit SecA